MVHVRGYTRKGKHGKLVHVPGYNRKRGAKVVRHRRHRR